MKAFNTKKNLECSLVAGAYDEVGGLFGKDEYGQWRYRVYPGEMPITNTAEMKALIQKLGSDAPDYLKRAKSIKHLQDTVMRGFGVFLRHLEGEGTVEAFMEEYRRERAKRRAKR